MGLGPLRRLAERRRAAPVLALAAIAVVAAGCTSGPSPQIRTAKVARATVVEVVEAPGTVTAKASATVSAPASGTVEELKVHEGQQVRTGQVLLRIDSPQAQAALKQAKQADAQAATSAAVVIPRADLSARQTEADRAATKAFSAARDAAGRISDPAAQQQALAAVAAAEAQYAAAQAQARDAIRRLNAGIGSVSASLSQALSSLGEAQRIQTRAAVTAAQRTVDALVVTAPIDGVVGFGASSAGTSGSDLSGLASQLPSSVSSQLGSLAGGTGGSSTQTGLAEGSPVSAGQALLTVTDVSTLSVRADVDETDVLLVSPGVQAGVTLDAVPGATYPATVSTVDLRPTTSTGGGVAYAVRLALGPGTTTEGERAPTPRPGMSAVVDLRVRTAKDAVSVPAAAVFRDGSRDAVWVVRGKVAAKRYVRLGAQGEARVEVLEGLDVGTVVVVRGADKVTQGQRIE